MPHTAWAGARSGSSIRALCSVLLNPLNHARKPGLQRQEPTHRPESVLCVFWPQPPPSLACHSWCLHQNGYKPAKSFPRKRAQLLGLRQKVQEKRASSCFLFGCCLQINGPPPYTHTKKVKLMFCFLVYFANYCLDVLSSTKRSEKS